RSPLAAAGRSDRGKKQILRDDSHSLKDNAARAAAKEPLRLFGDSLPHSHHRIHVTQAVGQRFHHMRRKMRRLLNEKVKSAAVDLRQTRRALRHSVGCAWSFVNQRHLTKERTRARRLEHKITKEDIHFP